MFLLCLTLISLIHCYIKLQNFHVLIIIDLSWIGSISCTFWAHSTLTIAQLGQETKLYFVFVLRATINNLYLLFSCICWCCDISMLWILCIFLISSRQLIYDNKWLQLNVNLLIHGQKLVTLVIVSFKLDLQEMCYLFLSHWNHIPANTSVFNVMLSYFVSNFTTFYTIIWT